MTEPVILPRADWCDEMFEQSRRDGMLSGKPAPISPVNIMRLMVNGVLFVPASAVEAEREACATVCDEEATRMKHVGEPDAMWTARKLAEQIRARSTA